MSEKRTIGLKQILVGPIALDGGMAADEDLVAIGVTFQESCLMTMDQEDDTDIYSEENDDPEESISGKLLRKLEWEIIDTSNATLKKAFGGELTGVGDLEAWEAPRQVPHIEMSVRIVAKTGDNIDIPRFKFRNSANWKFSKKDVNKIKMAGKVLTPTKAGVAPVRKYKTPAGA